MHDQGYAHSIEVWSDDNLVGGLYGLAIGRIFFGESMFHVQRDASKVALVHLVARLNCGGFRLLDAQFINPHLERLGAISIPRAAYQEQMEPLLGLEADFAAFRGDRDPDAVLRWAAGAQSSGSPSLLT